MGVGDIVRNVLVEASLADEKNKRGEKVFSQVLPDAELAEQIAQERADREIVNKVIDLVVRKFNERFKTEVTKEVLPETRQPAIVLKGIPLKNIPSMEGMLDEYKLKDRGTFTPMQEKGGYLKIIIELDQKLGGEIRVLAGRLKLLQQK